MARDRGFDRVRPRTGSARDAAAGDVRTHDPEGKRALFSAAAPRKDTPGAGSVTIDCSGCNERSIVGLRLAARAAFPSLVLGLGVTRGGRTTALSMAGEHPVWLRCPACRHRRWTRVSLSL